MWVSVLIALAGCSSAPRGARESGALDWNAGDATNPGPLKVERVVEPPGLAPPPFDPAPPPAPLITSVPAPPPRPHTNSYAETWIPLGRWAREHQVGSLKRMASAPAPVFALAASNGVLLVQA